MQSPVDLNIVLPALIPGATFRLSQTPTPHVLLEWRGPSRQPSQSAIDEFWASYEMPVVRDVLSRVADLETEVARLKNKES